MVAGPGVARLVDECKAAHSANRDSRVRGNDSVDGVALASTQAISSPRPIILEHHLVGRTGFQQRAQRFEVGGHPLDLRRERLSGHPGPLQLRIDDLAALTVLDKARVSPRAVS
jgi:hypothetical protein